MVFRNLEEGCYIISRAEEYDIVGIEQGVDDNVVIVGSMP